MRARALPPWIILLLGGLMFLLYAFPGLMTLDSVDQLTEARAGFYTDAHPPLMAVVWGLFDRVIAGPYLMLLLQGATFLIGSYLVLRRALPYRAAAIAASLLLLFPPVLTPMSFIWKDSLMAGLVVLGVGLVLSSTRRVRVAALVCFGFATAVKYNAFVATLPAIVLLFEWTPGKRWLQRYAIATGAWIAVTAAGMGVTTALVDQPMHFWHSTLAVWDITGTIAEADTLDDAELQRELAGTGLLVTDRLQERARALYATRDMGKLVLGDDRLWDLPVMGKVPAPQGQRDAIGAAWWSLVSGHAGAYLRHRIASFLDIVGVTYKTRSAVPPRLMKYPGFMTQIGLATHSYGFQTAWTNAHTWLWRHTPLFRQWIYIVIALVLLALCRGHRDVFALLASGLLAEASLFLIGPTPDFRYSHWTIVCACLAAILLAWRRAAGARGTADMPAASPRA